jgi:hypothetical protein
MRSILISLAIFIAAPAFAGQLSDNPSQQELAQSTEVKQCRDIDGRKLWAGPKAYYLQAWQFKTAQSGLLDDDAVSVVSFADNKPADLDGLREACK